MEWNRHTIADLIFSKILEAKAVSGKQYHSTKSGIGYFFIDDLLPIEIASKIYSVFPAADSMVLKKSLRENKYVAAQ